MSRCEHVSKCECNACKCANITSKTKCCPATSHSPLSFSGFRCSSPLLPPPLIHPHTHSSHSLALSLITLIHSSPLYSHTHAHTLIGLHASYSDIRTITHSKSLLHTVSVTIAHSDLTPPSLTSSVLHTHFHTLTL